MNFFRRPRLLGLWMAAIISTALATGASAGGHERSYSAQLIGKVGDISQPESVWVGAIEVRLPLPYILEGQRDAALKFMQSLAPRGRDIECRLTGERIGPAGGGTLVGDCVVMDPTDQQEIDLGTELIKRGFARQCEAPQAMIAIWPPVFDCL